MWLPIGKYRGGGFKAVPHANVSYSIGHSYSKEFRELQKVRIINIKMASPHNNDSNQKWLLLLNLNYCSIFFCCGLPPHNY